MKINLNTAMKIAKKHKSDIDHCFEDSRAFIFSKNDEVSFDDSPVVVLKENGEVVNLQWYRMEYEFEEPISEVDF